MLRLALMDQIGLSVWQLDYNTVEICYFYHSKKYIILYTYMLNSLPSFSVTMIVSFTDFKKMALVYFCTKHKFGKSIACEPDAMEVVIMSRLQRPSDRDVRKYLDRSLKRLCGARKDYVTSKAGILLPFQNRVYQLDYRVSSPWPPLL